MELEPEQLRVLGCLLEKERTTPDAYPLSLNGLVSACNQTTSREPVVHFRDDIYGRDGIGELAQLANVMEE